MDKSLLIPKVIHEIMSNKPVCGGCICSCSEQVRFLCFGYSTEDIEKWIAKNPEKVKSMED